MPSQKEKMVDEQEVNKIVETMKKKYKSDGIYVEEVNSSLKELRGLVSEGEFKKVDIENKDDVDAIQDPTAKKTASFYLSLKSIFEPVKKFFSNLSISQELSFQLYSANMLYSSGQYLALATAGGFIFGLFFMLVSLFVIFLFTFNILIAILLAFLLFFFGWFFGTYIILLQPNMRAKARGERCTIELLFALRHMSTELKAGVSLFAAIQSIASNDYGVLSEEFSRTIAEVEDGVDTKVALQHMALRVQSKPLRNAITNILRSIRIGGNLSKAMNDIAEDVSEEIKNKIIIFAQNMNTFSVIFIFIGIVAPVGAMVLGSIRNSPLSSVSGGLLSGIPLTPPILMVLFLFIMPLLVGGIIFFINIKQPRVW
jgi:archaeal flagellar protein FlaJ